MDDVAPDDSHRHVDIADRLRAPPRRRIEDRQVRVLTSLHGPRLVLGQSGVRSAVRVRPERLGHLQALARLGRVHRVVDPDEWVHRHPVAPEGDVDPGIDQRSEPGRLPPALAETALVEAALAGPLQEVGLDTGDQLPLRKPRYRIVTRQHRVFDPPARALAPALVGVEDAVHRLVADSVGRHPEVEVVHPFGERVQLVGRDHPLAAVVGSVGVRVGEASAPRAERPVRERLDPAKLDAAPTPGRQSDLRNRVHVVSPVVDLNPQVQVALARHVAVGPRRGGATHEVVDARHAARDSTALACLEEPSRLDAVRLKSSSDRGRARLHEDAVVAATGRGVLGDPRQSRLVDRDEMEVLAERRDRTGVVEGGEVGRHERVGLAPRRLVVAVAEEPVVGRDVAGARRETVQRLGTALGTREVGVDLVAPDRREVSVGIDEAGQDDAAVECDTRRVHPDEHVEVVGRADADDTAVADRDGLVDRVVRRESVDRRVGQHEVSGRGHTSRADGWDKTLVEMSDGVRCVALCLAPGRGARRCLAPRDRYPFARAPSDGRMNEDDGLDADTLAERVRAGDLRLYELEPHAADADAAATARRRVVGERTGTSLDAVSNYGIDAAAAENNIENMLGTVQIPLGVAGPLPVEGADGEREAYLPIATTEGALVASVNRGCAALRAGGGARARVTKTGMTRAPVFRVVDVAEAEATVEWVRDNVAALREAAESTTSHGELLDVTPYVVGDSVFLRFRYDTKDAMGMNMATIATGAACDVVEAETAAELVALSGNLCTDKKPAAINAVEGRGRSVTADAVLPTEVVEERLDTTAAAMAEINRRKNFVGSAKAASLGFNAHAANVVAGVFLATGQDEAQVVGGANAITTVEPREEGLYVSVSLASLEVGTVGGGTGLPTQGEALSLLGLRGGGDPPGSNADALAETIAAGVLAGELSLLAALSSRHLASAHASLGR